MEENPITFRLIDVEEGVTDVEIPRDEAWNVVHVLLDQLEGR